MKFKLNSEQVEFLEDLINECWFDGCDERKRPVPVLRDEKLMQRSAIRELWAPQDEDILLPPFVDTRIANVYRHSLGIGNTKLMWYSEWMFVVCISRGQRNRAERLIREATLNEPQFPLGGKPR